MAMIFQRGEERKWNQKSKEVANKPWTKDEGVYQVGTLKLGTCDPKKTRANAGYVSANTNDKKDIKFVPFMCSDVKLKSHSRDTRDD